MGVDAAWPSLRLPPTTLDRHGHVDFAWAGYALVFLSAVVPTTYQPLKGLLLVVCLLLVAYQVMRSGRLGLHPSVLGLGLVYSCVGLLWIARGMVTMAPGAISMAGVVVAWPLVFTALCAGANDRRVLKRLVTTLVVATLVIEVYSLWYVTREVGWIPRWLFIAVDQGLSISVRPGFVEFNLYSIASLLYLVPFCGAALMMWPDDGQQPAQRRTLWLTLGLGLVVTVLSGRRALLLVVGLAAPLALVMWVASGPRLRRVSWPLVRSTLVRAGLVAGTAGVFLAWAYGLTPERIVSTFSEGFAFDVDPIALMRARQLDALLDAWWQAPVLGLGHGASAPGMIRDTQMPWAYELSYAALLMQTGVAGVAMYAVGFVWIGLMAVLVARHDDELGRWLTPMLVGLTCFLVGNATNPYLLKFDYMWVIFVAVAVINHWLTSRTSPLDAR